MILKNGKTIGTAKVISNDLIPKGASVPGRKLKSIGYITLHNTGLIDVKSNNFHRSLKRENALKNGRQASWTFTVDDIEIYQEVPTSWETWHAGNSTGNKNSISIEMCMWNNKEKQRKTYENSARLVAELMKMHKISIDKVVQHNKWSGKNCPEFLRAKKHGYDWTYFINLVKKYYKELTTPVTNTTTTTTNSTYEVTATSLNVRNGRGTEYKVVGSLKKGDRIEVWSFAKDKNGMEWGSFRYSFNPDIIGYVSKNYLKKI